MRVNVGAAVSRPFFVEKCLQLKLIYAIISLKGGNFIQNHRKGGFYTTGDYLKTKICRRIIYVGLKRKRIRFD